MWEAPSPARRTIVELAAAATTTTTAKAAERTGAVQGESFDAIKTARREMMASTPGHTPTTTTTMTEDSMAVAGLLMAMASTTTPTPTPALALTSTSAPITATTTIAAPAAAVAGPKTLWATARLGKRRRLNDWVAADRGRSDSSGRSSFVIGPESNPSPQTRLRNSAFS
ncbi:MAG: hypothetical protein M1826_002325 [Phylliscum demangeonii]|nr:MAG: hypothetical protein M1826_002325 [Phylliscum demangeonii]